MSSSSRPTSPSPVRPQRVFSPPPRVRSPPPLAPAPRVFSPTHQTSQLPLSRVVSPPPTLNILPSTPVRPSSPEPAPSALSTTELSPAPTKSKNLDAIHEVLETAEASEPESGQKISSNSSSLILPPSSPQRKPTNGTVATGQIQPLEGQRSMTVEVTSKPQAQLAPTSDKDKSTTKVDANLKSVKSNDTMKPPSTTKPPKKKRARTANIANTNSSKAQIFAAKVAAVVDANPGTSDSEEAFVYDSNSGNQPKSSRPAMHSRTPSMTSINSAYMAGNATYGTVPAGRGRGGSNDEGYNFPTMTRTQGRSLHPKNVSSSDENRHRSILPEDSLFTPHGKNSAQDTISPQPSKNSLHPPRGSPRTKSSLPRSNTVRTPKWAQPQFYDGDDDDTYSPSNERVPLLPRDMNRSTNRRTKAYKSRSRVLSQKQQSQVQQNYERRRSARYARAEQNSKCWPGLAGTAILVFTLLLLTMLTIGFVFQTSRNLENVNIQNLTNIVVSQEELIMDLHVEAGNPNILPVLIGDTVNLDVFARSDHFNDKPKKEQRKRRTAEPFWPWDPPPIKPPKNFTEGSSLLLGTIRSLEAPLSFPSNSFSRKNMTVEKGQMKLVGPAVNATDGPEKWKKCITANFELIVRGIMKYRAPIGGRERAVAVEWRGTVDPLGNRVWSGDSRAQ